MLAPPFAATFRPAPPRAHAVWPERDRDDDRSRTLDDTFLEDPETEPSSPADYPEEDGDDATGGGDGDDRDD